MEEKSFQKYFILWFSQLISGLGSSMTGFALVLWAYGQSHSALSVSLMSFCNYVPYVLLSLFVGNFIDRHKKNRSCWFRTASRRLLRLPPACRFLLSWQTRIQFCIGRFLWTCREDRLKRLMWRGGFSCPFGVYTFALFSIKCNLFIQFKLMFL